MIYYQPNQFAIFEGKYLGLVISETSFQAYEWIKKKKNRSKYKLREAAAKLTMMGFKWYNMQMNLSIQSLRSFYNGSWQLIGIPVSSSNFNFTQTRIIHQVQTYLL